MNNIFKKPLDWIAKHFKDDPSGMLIFTGVVGWILSSAAQIGAIVTSPKLSDKQKSFLFPQEFSDAITNIGLFFSMTLLTKWIVKNLFRTGKFAPESVKKYLKQHQSELGAKIGSLDLNLDELAKTAKNFPKEQYEIYKNFNVTMATIASGILASNVLTPVIRNKKASAAQQKYIDYKNKQTLYAQNYSSNMKI